MASMEPQRTVASLRVGIMWSYGQVTHAKTRKTLWTLAIDCQIIHFSWERKGLPADRWSTKVCEGHEKGCALTGGHIDSRTQVLIRLPAERFNKSRGGSDLCKKNIVFMYYLADDESLVRQQLMMIRCRMSVVGCGCQLEYGKE
jgi:hypothetical protein